MLNAKCLLKLCFVRDLLKKDLKIIYKFKKMSSYSPNSPEIYEGNQAGQNAQQDREREEVKDELQNIRHWHSTKFGKFYKQEKYEFFEFVVMTYNMLSQEALSDHMWLYNSCNPRHLDWNYRAYNLLREIVEHSADILCFQEIEQDPFERFFKPHLEKQGYDGYFNKKTGNKLDGCAIFFKKEKFIAEKVIPVDFFQEKVKVLNRHNVGLVLVLKPYHSDFENDKLIVATTHLLFNPKRVDVRLCQIRMLLAEAERQATKFVGPIKHYHPVIVCGDFNFKPHSVLYKFLNNGHVYSELVECRLEDESQDHLSLLDININHQTQFENNEKEKEPSSNKSAKLAIPKCDTFYHTLNLISTFGHLKHYSHFATTHHVTANWTVDYIFYNVADKMQVKTSSHCYSKVVEESKLRHLGYYTLPTSFQMDALGCLPNAYVSSDHLCLLSHFCLVPDST